VGHDSSELVFRTSSDLYREVGGHDGCARVGHTRLRAGAGRDSGATPVDSEVRLSVCQFEQLPQAGVVPSLDSAFHFILIATVAGIDAEWQDGRVEFDCSAGEADGVVAVGAKESAAVRGRRRIFRIAFRIGVVRVRIVGIGVAWIRG